MKANLFDSKGLSTANTVELSDDVFGIEPNNHAIYLDVKQHLANRRQGTHKSKERNEISGSTKKLKRQKGTGGARAGSVKSGTRVGGGRIFGPRPRNYHFKLNVKLKRLARKSAFAHQAQNGNLVVLKSADLSSVSTKSMTELLKNMSLDSQKVLMIMADYNDTVYLSARNIKNVKVVSADSFNTFDLLNARKVVLFEDALAKIENTLN
ncbi:MAG: hypothetical protein RL264_290 [Bacteroidota bacterium]|jgi:large subunit ribosomal protein L4